MEKKTFVTKEQLDEIVKQYPTPFHLYDEKGIRENIKAVKEAFSWNKGFKEYFAVKACPNPFLINILKEYGCGCDCSSYTELMMSSAIGCTGKDIMFSSNDTPAEEYAYAYKLGATINLDDITHIDFLEDTIGTIPKRISCRYNPGGTFELGNGIMDNPGDAKYGMTTEQIFDAFRILKEKGAEEFGIHAFLASNTVTNEYYPELAKRLFELAVKLKEETGAVDFKIEPICVYSVKGKTRVNKDEEKETFGMLYVADIFSFEEIHSEIEKIVICDELIKDWTYPLIQPKLIEEAARRGHV